MQLDKTFTGSIYNSKTKILILEKEKIKMSKKQHKKFSKNWESWVYITERKGSPRAQHSEKKQKQR